MSEELCFTPAAELAARIRRRDLSPVEVVEAFLERIEERNGTINAYVTVLGDEARETAREAERALMAGDLLGPLHGVPVAIKDLFDYKAGVRNTFGSKPLPATCRTGTRPTSSAWRERARLCSARPIRPSSDTGALRTTSSSARRARRSPPARTQVAPRAGAPPQSPTGIAP